MFCQLDSLRRCLPGRVRSVLDGLPRSLDTTYERTLQDIGDENWGYAHRLFQCIAVASRPLRVEELAEFLAINFDSGESPTLVAGWRPENPGNTVLSICSSLITVVAVDGPPVVQFSHFSVQEFLMSSRLASGHLSHYSISFKSAHTIIAQACLSVLLQLDNRINKWRIDEYPLARYAAQHWVDHAKFRDVSSHAEHAMKLLFDRSRPHFAAWVWIYDMDRESRKLTSETPLEPNAPPIYYATLLDFPDMTEWLVTVRPQDVNEQGGYYGTPLCAAAARGRSRVVQRLVKCGAHVDAAGGNGWSPLLWALDSGCLELSRLLLALGADINFRDPSNLTPLSLASKKGHLELAILLLQRGADANVWEHGKGTILIRTLQKKDLSFAQLLLDHGADVNVRNDDGRSLLHLASANGDVVSLRWLLQHGASFRARNNPGGTRFSEGGRQIMGSFPGSLYSNIVPIWSRGIIDLAKRIHLPDVVGETECAGEGPTTKRRALLVGISYYYSESDTLWPLRGSHEDVDLFWDLLCRNSLICLEISA